jgi:ABC-type nitrate/sulfonate/bicarbonate transport system substrate-binding protein
VLVALAALTSATGARMPVIWFKICPFVLTTAAALILARTFA